MSREDPAERERVGLEARRRVPPEEHAELSTLDRRSPVEVLEEQIPARVPELVPLRHERMRSSPFTFYRGAAAVMAADLAATPRSGMHAQLCGDAHLDNFGMFASPERNLVFDINDFDETHPGPWEWDVKRLVTSLVVAGRGNGFSDKQTRRIVRAAVQRYRDAMAAFAAMGNLALWHTYVDLAAVQKIFGDELDKSTRKRIDKSTAKARRKDHEHALAKLTEKVDGRRRIISDPPAVVPIDELAGEVDRADLERLVETILVQYGQSLDPGNRRLVSSYTFVDLARRAGGIGSVGTRCWLVLMQGRDDDDPLFLQVKESEASVLAPYLDSPAHAGGEGERVVVGQRIMQAAGDNFLGWHQAEGLDGLTRDFYVRQLYDWKGSATVETMSPKLLRLYGELCAWTLARAHARSGDRIAIAAYLGDDDRLSEALVSFAHAYADLNEQDFAIFAKAVDAGALTSATSRSA
jgi:uncharacterized protein (DUF2252 family)